MKATAVVALLMAGALAAPARAQVLYGTILGRVQDPTGAAVPGATVAILNTATNQSRQATTNEVGGYSFPNVLAGAYRLTVRATGFQVFTETGIAVTINTVTRVNVQLLAGELTESVTVAGQAVALQTDKADVHVELHTPFNTSNYNGLQSSF